MEIDLRSDAELLNALCDEAPVVQDRQTGRQMSLAKKVIAAWTGRAVQTVSDYATGRLNIPIEFWRSLLDHYFDPRIVVLLVPDDYDWEVHPTLNDPPRLARQFFRAAVEETGAHHTKQTYIADLLADGRIDELDGLTVQQYADAYHRHRELDWQLHRSIMTAYRSAVSRKAATL